MIWPARFTHVGEGVLYSERGFIKGWHHHQGRMNRLRSSNWLLIGLAAGMIVLALAGVALLVTYFVLARQPAANDSWVNPLTVIKTEAIAPDLESFSQLVRVKIRSLPGVKEISTSFSLKEVKHAGTLPVL